MERSLGDGVTLRPARPADADGFHRLNHPLPVPTEKYAWMYFENPFRGDRHAGWVLERDPGIIGGKLLHMYWPLRVLGRTITCCFDSDIFVEPGLRGKSLGLLLFQNNFEVFTEGLVLGSSANANSTAVWTKLGGGNVPGGSQRYQRVLSVRGWTAAGLARTPLGRRHVAARPGLAAMGSRVTPPPHRSGSDWETVGAGDPELAAFLEEAEKPLPITTRRSETFLRWRYEHCPISCPEMVAVREGSRIVGFLAMQVASRHKVIDLRFAEVLDFVCRFDRPEVFPKLRRAVREWTSCVGADVIEWRGTHPALAQVASGWLWLDRSNWNPFLYYSREISAAELQSTTWHLVMADGDLVM